jgi:hypothetical protein
MASLYITEYTENGFRQLGGLPVAPEPGLDQAPVAIGAVAPSAAFGASTRVVRVHCDAICSIAFGKTPVATTANKRLPADHTEYFSVNPGDKLSVIANT